MDWLANPVFLRQEPPRPVQLALLLTLLWVALPLLAALPAGVMVLFAVLWLLRLGLWALNIKPLSWLWLVLLLAAAGVVVYWQLGTVIGRDGGVAFLLLLTVLKSYEGRGLRDWQVLLLAMLVVMGGAVLFNQNLWMAAWLLLGILALSTDMALLGGLPLRQACRQSVLALLLALPLMAVLFVAVPRVAEPLWRVPQQNQSQAVTGLSDTLRPGSISNLILSNEPAFNAIFANGYTPRQQDLYWRVMVMAEFDGNQWRAMDERYIDEARVPPVEGGNVDYQLIARDEQGRIPALDYPVLAPGQNLNLRLGAVVRVNRSRDGLRRIPLQAALSPYLHQTLDAGERAFYTRLPDGLNLQTTALAQQWRRSQANTRALVDQALAYFRRQGFVYTLQPVRGNGRNGTDFFLFQGREGFCEDYADALVWLMRAADVPARIVTGYQGGEYNAQGGFWQVRSKDAHAWVEVWLAAENTWLRVDPTAAVAEVRTSQGVAAALPPTEQAWLAPRNHWAYRLGQSGQFYWQQWVVNFDANRQQNLFQRLGLGRVNLASVSVLLLLGGGLALLPLLWWWQRQQRRSRAPLTDGFMLLKSTLVAGSDEELSALGPQQLQQLLQQHNRYPPALAALLDEYIRHVYAAAQLPPKAVQRRWYRRVKRLLRQMK